MDFLEGRSRDTDFLDSSVNFIVGIVECCWRLEEDFVALVGIDLGGERALRIWRRRELREGLEFRFLVEFVLSVFGGPAWWGLLLGIMLGSSDIPLAAV